MIRKASWGELVCRTCGGIGSAACVCNLNRSIEGFAIIAIVETTVAGVKAFHAEEPGWRCHRQAHNDEQTAIRCAQRHADKA